MKLPRVIKLDIDQEYYNLIPAQQGDTARVLKFQILNSGIPFLLENKTIRARIKKPDGNVCYNDMEIINASKGECDLKLTNQILIEPGMCKVQLEIMENLEILSTIIFAICIRESIDIKNAAESTNEFTALENGIIKLDEWDKYFKETSGKIEEKYTEKLSGLATSLEEKVNKEVGKGLSTHDYTDADKIEVSTIKEKATKLELSNLDTKINSQASGSPKKVFATVSELQSDVTANTVEGKKNIYLVSSDGKWYYWNGSAWTSGGVYQSTGISENSISENHTTFFSKSKNRFDMNKATVGKVLENDGAISEDPTKILTDYIPVKPGELIYQANEYTGAFYNSEKAFISNKYFGNASFTVPSNAAYYRTSLYNSASKDKFYISTENKFEPFGEVKIIDNSLEKAIKNILGNNVLNGKTICLIGDSYTEENSYSTKKWWKYIAERTGCIFVNKSVSGTGFCRRTSGNNNFVDRIDGFLGNEGYDAIIVFGGINDSGSEQILGEMNSKDVNTVNGAINHICNKLQTLYSTSKIGFITPPMTSYRHGYGNKISEIGTNIKAICRDYSIPVFDLCQDLGLCPWIEACSNVYYADQTHLNEKGDLIESGKIQPFLESLFF
ncbi:MAG: BppU family phage baseplate upper protein [Clostridium paraputrificum]